jgi:predicted ATPase/class 3 adenylate cyclase
LHAHSEVRTYLFTDIEGSTRMWEENPAGMRPALARHDALSRAAIEGHRGVLVKRTGDGLHAVFGDPADALAATLELQLALADPRATAGIQLNIRCGLHAGADEPRDGDFYGTAVNRAARIMSTAHGGQVLLSQVVASMVEARLPEKAQLLELGAVRLRDLASPERLYQLVHPKLRDKFPALRSLEATPNNLPQQLTSFVGREAELAQVKGLVAQYRLLTLLGVGGIGKSRLSLQAGADLIDDFPDGVWLVELAQITDPRLVPQAVASALGVKEAAGRPVSEALVKFFKDRRLLLILDNCEHLLAACAELAKELLEAGPHSKVLASSREPLRIGGEATYPVPALPDSDAERLFVERARGAKPDFRLNGSGSAVTSVCRRLDGIPLAIELAAARVRTLSPDAIASRLDDRFRLLTRGDRAALPRQQTLRALIDWSHDLLTEPERAVFRRLAVFAGGWTVEGAESVVAFSGMDQAEVLNHVSDLAEKSLVVVELGGERYRYLETVRQYAYEKLDEAGEIAEARMRHLQHCLAFAEKARPEIVGPRQAEWLARLDLERENLHAAHAWCDHAPDGAESGLRLVYLQKQYWLNRGLFGLGLRLSTDALARPGGSQQARIAALYAAGQMYLFLGSYLEARRRLEQCRSAAAEAGDHRTLSLLMQPLGMAYIGLRDLAMARRVLEESLAGAERLGEPRELAAAMMAVGQLARLEGRPRDAEEYHEKALQQVRKIDDRQSIAIALLNLAMVAVESRDAARARELLLDALTIIDETAARYAGQSLLEITAALAVLRGEHRVAAQLYGVAEAESARHGMRRDPADAAFLDPQMAAARAALGGAFSGEEEAGRALSYDEGLARARAFLR